MCEECHQTPCHPRCPNADEPPVVTECDMCGAEIYAGDEYFEIAGGVYCEECIEGCKKEAEVDEW